MVKCNCSICLDPEQHRKRKEISDNVWAWMLTEADTHRLNHKDTKLQGCDYCEGRKQLTAFGVPRL